MRTASGSLACSMLRCLAAGGTVLQAQRVDAAGAAGAAVWWAAVGTSGRRDSDEACPSSHLWASTSLPAAGAAFRGAATHARAGRDAASPVASPATTDGAHECGPGCDHSGHAHAHAHEHAAAKGGGGAHSAAFEEQERACWSCHDRHKRGSLLCTSCDKIQPVDSSLTYFDLMGIKQPTFDVDEAALERRYKLLQWTLHPDKTVVRTKAERAFSAEHASAVNQAYGVLRRPLSRANYLLRLAGVPAGDAAEGIIEDPGLLMEVMEAREAVESTDDPRRLHELLASARASQRGVEAQLSLAFGAGDTSRAAVLVARLTYYVRLEEAILAKL